MSHRRFCGWTPRTGASITRTGPWWAPWRWRFALASAVETEWDDEQRELFLALDRWERDLGPHGHPMSEATSPDADPANPAGTYYYAVGLPIVDYAQQVIDDARDAYREQYKDSRIPNGLIWIAERVERNHDG